MITIILMGGLGNQIFQWMLGRALEYRGKNVQYDTTILEYDFSRRYLLGDLGFSLKLTRKAHPVPNEGTLAFHPEILDMPDGATLMGYWQSFEYVRGLEQKIRSEIFGRIKISPTTMKIGGEIVNRESCMIHVRRSDNLRPGSKAYHGLTSADESTYYKKAIALVREKIPNVQFYVFSDDPNWIIEHMVDPDMICIFHNAASFTEDQETHELTKNEDGREVEDFFLMSLCRHAIIANSSFSCLAAWMNPLEGFNMQRTVVCPDPWFQTKEVDGSEICPPHWTRIGVR